MAICSTLNQYLGHTWDVQWLSLGWLEDGCSGSQSGANRSCVERPAQRSIAQHSTVRRGAARRGTHSSDLVLMNSDAQTNSTLVMSMPHAFHTSIR